MSHSQPPASASKRASSEDCSVGSTPKKAVVESAVRLAWATVTTADVKKSTDWFASVLGWNSGHADASGMWSELKASEGGGTNLAFRSVGLPGRSAGQVRLTFVVPKLDVFHAKIAKETGVSVDKAPTKELWGGYKAEYTAPDGTKFDVLQEWIDSAAAPPAAPAAGQDHAGSGETKKRSEDVKVCWTTIPVGDLARAKQFYTNVFGFKWDEWKPHASLFQAPGDTRHKGHVELSKERITYPAIWLSVTDIDAALVAVSKHGGRVVHAKEPIDPTCAQVGHKGTFQDTEGNIMLLHSG